MLVSGMIGFKIQEVKMLRSKQKDLPTESDMLVEVDGQTQQG